MLNDTIPNQGWQCPCCKRVYSPTTVMCLYCVPKEAPPPTAKARQMYRPHLPYRPHEHVPTEGGTPLENLDLTVRTANCLKAEGVNTIEQLSCWTETELLRTPNLGQKSLREIKEQLAAIGITIKERP